MEQGNYRAFIFGLIFLFLILAGSGFLFFYFRNQSGRPQTGGEIAPPGTAEVSASLASCKATAGNPLKISKSFGIDAMPIWPDYGPGSDYIEKTFAKYGELGVKLARFNFSWNWIESSDGNFDWSYYDKAVIEAQKRNIAILGILATYPPKWLTDRMGGEVFLANWTNAAKQELIRAGYKNQDADAFADYSARLLKNQKDETAKKRLEALSEKTRSDIAASYEKAAKTAIGAYRTSAEWISALDNVRRIADKTVERYKPGGALAKKMGWENYGVEFWEASNEPNYPCCGWLASFPDAEMYSAALASINSGVRKQDPRAVIVLGGLSADGAPMESFIEDIYKSGAKFCFDVNNIHLYKPIAEFPRWIDKIKNIAGKFNDASKPIWITEANMYMGDEARQAEFAEDIYEFSKAGTAAATFWFSIRDSSGASEPAYGLLRYDFSEKAAFNALKKLINPSSSLKSEVQFALPI